VLRTHIPPSVKQSVLAYLRERMTDDGIVPRS